MNIYNKLSLRTKILGMVLTSITLLGGGSILAMKQFSQSYTKKISGIMSDHAKSLGERIGAQFFERYGDVQAFALNEAIQSMDPARIQSALDSYVNLYGIYDLIVVVDKSGKFIAANTKNFEGKSADHSALSGFNYSTADWFQAVINNKTSDDKDKGFSGTYFEPFIEDPLIKTAFKQAKVGSGFSAAIKNNKGETIGVISNRASSRWIENEFVQIYEFIKASGMTNAEILMADANGKALIVHAPKNNDGKNEVLHDLENITFKKSLIPQGSQLEQLTKLGQTGAIREFDHNKKIDQWIGVHPIDNPKWIKSIGWTVLIEDEASRAEAAVTSAMNIFYLYFFISVFISITLAVWFAVIIAKLIDRETISLAKNSSEVSDASTKIAASATELSESATEQAAALQETVAAVDEISAMVEKNAEAANKSKEMSGQSRMTAEKGQRIVENMVSAINDIDSSNNEIATQMEHSNRELSEITKLINDISNKTKVINEIVFQTKLLSFNASVEAARAGEYGKGFSVVAEEVGNLAQMSGNAAKDITNMLENSVHKVESIVRETQSKVERLMASSKEKVKAGSETAQQCNEALSEIINNVASVDTLVSEIAVASAEQSTGIQEISKAVGQMEVVIQQNTAVAQSSSVAAEQLRTQSVSLNQIVDNMVQMIRGEGAELKKESSTKPNAKKSIAKVFKMKPKKTTTSDKPHAPTATAGATDKKVVGQDWVPSSDDPGFGE